MEGFFTGKKRKGPMQSATRLWGETENRKTHLRLETRKAWASRNRATPAKNTSAPTPDRKGMVEPCRKKKGKQLKKGLAFKGNAPHWGKARGRGL